jgi:hypothetical protein
MWVELNAVGHVQAASRLNVQPIQEQRIALSFEAQVAAAAQPSWPLLEVYDAFALGCVCIRALWERTFRPSPAQLQMEPIELFMHGTTLLADGNHSVWQGHTAIAGMTRLQPSIRIL